MIMTSSPAANIVRLTAPEVGSVISELAEILADSVLGGASVSFMAPLAQADAEAYWQGLLPAVTGGTTILLAALIGDRMAGTVQLDMATPPNQRHRADVRKLLVHRRARRRGVARALMAEIEVKASALGRTLLTLDTTAGSAADVMYQTLGYNRVGVIPGYARLPDGPLCETAIYYKQLR